LTVAAAEKNSKDLTVFINMSKLHLNLNNGSIFGCLKLKVVSRSIILLSILIFSMPIQGLAQSTWSPIERIPGYADDTLPPYMVADHNRTVHAFSSQWMGDKNNLRYAIIYSKWSLDNGWTLPVDVILSPVKEARVEGVLLDVTNVFHLIFFGGEDPTGNIYYTRAVASKVGQVSGWSEPVLIGKNALTPDSAALAGDGKKNLWVVYSGKVEGATGLYFTYSSDSGVSWTEPAPIFLCNIPGQSAYGIRLYVGQSGRMHAVWYVVDGKGHNRAAYYAAYDLDTKTWSMPIEFDKGYGIDAGMGISEMEVVENQGFVFVVYNNGIPPDGVPPAEWVRISKDGGQTWTDPYRPFPRLVGRNGVISFTTDSNGKLSIFFINRIPSFTNSVYSDHGGLFQSTWLTDHWSEPEFVVDSLDPRVGSMIPYDACSITSQGNVVLTTWRSDPGGAVHNGAWFSYKSLDAPELPIVPLQTLGQPDPIQVNPTLSPKPGSSSTVDPQLNGKTPIPSIQNGMISPVSTQPMSLILGLTPVFLLITVVMVIQFRRHQIRH
jgi:hypothetical protein